MLLALSQERSLNTAQEFGSLPFPAEALPRGGERSFFRSCALGGRTRQETQLTYAIASIAPIEVNNAVRRVWYFAPISVECPHRSSDPVALAPLRQPVSERNARLSLLLLSKLLHGLDRA